MKIKLRGATVTDETRAEHNQQTRMPILIGFFVVMAVLLWLFTHVGTFFGIPSPEDVFGTFAEIVDYDFDNDGNVDSQLQVQSTDFWPDNDSERAWLFGAICGAFLCGYFLPLRYKRPSYVFWFLAAFDLLYGWHLTTMFLTGHLFLYLLLHGPHRKNTELLSTAFGMLATLLIWVETTELKYLLLYMSAGGATSWAAFKYVLNPVLTSQHRAAKLIPAIAMHLPFLAIYGGIYYELASGVKWDKSLAVIIFMYQWARLITYHMDYRDGEVPKDLPLLHYLSVFLSPAVIPNYRYAPYLAQGYTYLESSFYNNDKNSIITGGLKLWSIAIFYLIFGEYIVDCFKHYMVSQWNVPVYKFISSMVEDYCDGTPMSTPTVLLSTICDQYRIFLLWGAVTHFKVGTWRVLGYNVDPQYNKPWLATNLANLWSRFAFHYREFLVRAVYYPVFFRVFRNNTSLRIFTAIMVATIIGNPFWGHTPAKLIYNGITFERFFRLILRSWPYYILLGLGISLCHLYLMRKVRTRKPWTRDRWFVVDILCSYLTIQYFSLIHVFIRPQSNSNLWDHVKLFLIGLGIHLD